MDFIMDKIIEERYDKIFENTYLFTKKKLEDDSEYGVEQLKALLKGLYVNDGNDLLGRGELYDVSLNAQIAACESLLSEFDK